MFRTLGIAPASRAPASYDATILADSPVGYWPLNETSGTTAADLSGHGNNGTYEGGFTLGQAGIGDGEPAVGLNGSSGYVSTATEIASPGPQPPFTLECWFRTTTAGGIMTFGSGQTGSLSGLSYDRLMYVGTDDKLYAMFYNGQVEAVNSTSTYTDGNWHYVAWAVTTGGDVLYVDGALVASYSGAVVPVSYAGWWRIGDVGPAGLPAQPPEFFTGSLAKAAVYDYALTSAQVSAHYAAQTSSGGAAASAQAVSAAVSRASLI